MIMIGLFKRRFSTHEVAEITGIAQKRICTWVSRGMIKIVEEIKLGGRKKTFNFDFIGLCSIKILEALSDYFTMENFRVRQLIFDNEQFSENIKRTYPLPLIISLDKQNDFHHNYPDVYKKFGSTPHIDPQKFVEQEIEKAVKGFRFTLVVNVSLVKNVLLGRIQK